MKFQTSNKKKNDLELKQYKCVRLNNKQKKSLQRASIKIPVS